MEATTTETIEFNDNTATIKIIPDTDPESPREWDNLGTIAHWHSRYTLGDEEVDGQYEFKVKLATDIDPDFDERLERLETHVYSIPSSLLEEKDHLNEFYARAHSLLDDFIERYYILLPVYIYDHSGITISTGPFHCPWDSGQVGFIYVSKEKVRKEYGWQRISKQRAERIEGYLKGEIKTYDQYLTGDVYGFVVELEGACGGVIEEDSCWGFYGEEAALEEAKGIVKYWQEKEAA